MMLYRMFLFALCCVLVAGSTLGYAAPAQSDTTQVNSGSIDADTLYLFNWAQYMDPAILRAFEEKYDVKVVRSFFSSNPDLFAKLRAGGVSQYDVIFPSDYYVPRLVKTGLIQPLDLDLIPNYANLLPKFQNPPYDPGGKDKVYSVAYQWGTTGVLYNTDVFGDPPHSWALLFDPDVNSKYPFAMSGDPLFMISVACAYLGYDFSCTKTAEPSVLKKAARLIIKTKGRPNFSGFKSGSPAIAQMGRGSLKVAIGWNGDLVSNRRDAPETYANVRYFLPKEGTLLWVDNMAIPADAPHPKLAHKFINFILKPKIGAQLSNWVAYASPNKAAQPYLDKDLSKPPVIPPESQMGRLHFLPSVKGKRLKMIQQLWTAVKSQ